MRNFFSSPEVKDTVQHSNAILNREQRTGCHGVWSSIGRLLTGKLDCLTGMGGGGGVTPPELSSWSQFKIQMLSIDLKLWLPCLNVGSHFYMKDQAPFRTL